MLPYHHLFGMALNSYSPGSALTIPPQSSINSGRSRQEGKEERGRTDPKANFKSKHAYHMAAHQDSQQRLQSSDWKWICPNYS